MSLLIPYLLKLSISLAIVWLFYQFVLRRLTFYNSNRWYLLGCTMLAFLVPLINIAPVISGSEGDEGIVMRFIPAVQQYTVAWGQTTDCPTPVGSTGMNKWDWMIAAVVVGATFFLLKFIIRYISFLLMRRKAKLLSAGDVNLYQVDKDIIPFSFGNSIFINQQLHNDTELKEIIRHEFVHVKQKHTHDIIWGELLCILNWYNPFAWLIRNAIRQNLEFIADNKVLENGLDKKQYQYLLLKVIGNRHFSIANQFNFSSLKKRIAMMNKVKSARSHLLKFLFLLPLGGVLLVAFRNQQTSQQTVPQKVQPQKTDVINAYEFDLDIKGNKVDTIFMKNSKGEIVKIGSLEKLETADVYGNKFLLMVDGKEVTTLTTIDKSTIVNLKTMFAREAKKIYGEKGKYGVVEIATTNSLKDTVPDELLNDKGYYIEVTDNKGNCTLVVWNKNKKEVARLLLTKWNEKKAYYENLYGEIHVPPAPPEPPMPPTPAGTTVPAPPTPPTSSHAPTAQFHAVPAPDVEGVPASPAAGSIYATPEAPPAPAKAPDAAGLPENVRSLYIKDKKAVVTLKNGNKEEYNLDNATEKAAFDKKYPKVSIDPPPPPRIEHRSFKAKPAKTSFQAVVSEPVTVHTSVNMKPEVVTTIKPVASFNAKPVTATVKTATSVDTKVSVTPFTAVEVQ